MEIHRRRLKTERRPRSDQGDHERPAEKVWEEAKGRWPTDSVGGY
ncbi:hypothetical protein [Methylomonas fluvii]|nr:hypothetical protein [Methylomonas fluvii]